VQRSRSSLSKNHVRITIAALFVGLGLSLFLTATHSWFYRLFFTAIALFFDLSGIFLFSKIGGRSLLAGSESGTWYRLLFTGLLVLWGWLLFSYCRGSDYAQLLQEGEFAQREASDPTCSPNQVRVLAGLPHDFGPAYPPPGTASEGICTVQWMRVAGFETRSCVVLESGSGQAVYCLGRGRIRRFFNWNGLRRGDMVVARTVLGRPSAFFLYPSTSLDRILLHPRGEIVKTVNDPDVVYLWHLEQTFMLLFVYLLLGTGLPIRILT
jgi:hypothetical protein